MPPRPTVSTEMSQGPLQEIDPSPVDDSPVEELRVRSEAPPSKSGSTTALGLREHSLTWWLTRIQRYSSYTFTAFVAAHLTNTAVIPLATQSVSTSDTYLLLTRPYYQSALLEPVVVAVPLLAHIASGVALRIHRHRQALRWYGGADAATNLGDRWRLSWPRVSGTSALGFILVPLLSGHVLANRIVPLYVDGGSSGVGLAYVAHGFARHPLVAYLGYSALVATAVWHSVWGWAKWLNLEPRGGLADDEEGRLTYGPGQKQRQRRRWGINVVALLTTVVWLAGGLRVVGRGGLSTGWIGKNFDHLYRSIPLVGRWA